MQRPERIVYIGVSALIGQLALLIIVWMIAILANFTALQRMYHVWNLERMEKESEMESENKMTDQQLEV